MIFHRFTFLFCFLGVFWITASEVDFLKMCEVSGRGLTFQYRERHIEGGAVTASDASWKESIGGYQFVISPRGESEPFLSNIDVYTPTHVDSIFPGILVRHPATTRLRSFADYYLAPTTNHYGGYIRYTTNLLGEDFQAFERTSQVPEMLVAGLFRTPYKEVVLFDSRGVFRQRHSYTSSNNLISSVILDEFRFKTTPLHSISTNGLEFFFAASDLEYDKKVAGFIRKKHNISQGVNFKSTILTSMVILPISLLVLKWIFYFRREKTAK